MNDLDFIMTLAEAGAELGRSQSTLRNQVKAGRLRARLIGKTWVTTRDEVERYRREHLGKVGRPAKDRTAGAHPEATSSEALGAADSAETTKTSSAPVSGRSA